MLVFISLVVSRLSENENARIERTTSEKRAKKIGLTLVFERIELSNLLIAKTTNPKSNKIKPDRDPE